MSLSLKQQENANLYITEAGSLEFIFAKKNGSFVILSTPKKQSED